MQFAHLGTWGALVGHHIRAEDQGTLINMIRAMKWMRMGIAWVYVNACAVREIGFSQSQKIRLR